MFHSKDFEFQTPFYTIDMKELDILRQKIKNGQIPKRFPEFGGANLIITKNQNRNFHEDDVVVYSDHASALSWLVVELKHIYSSEIDYINKYDFYPGIGNIIIRALTEQKSLSEILLHILDEVENNWGEK
ncbi:MAG: hypothetical protein ACO259_01655 [Bacteroidia bacterium]|jgi:hypothetical protein